MNKKTMCGVIIVLQFFIIVDTGYSLTRRVYCKADGIIVEHRTDENYTADNKLNNYKWFVIDDSQIPQHEYAEQLRCNGSVLIADHNFKPNRVIDQETLEHIQSELDIELAKDSPDAVTVIRMQREIEKLKRGSNK